MPNYAPSKENWFAPQLPPSPPPPPPPVKIGVWHRKMENLPEVRIYTIEYLHYSCRVNCKVPMHNTTVSATQRPDRAKTPYLSARGITRALIGGGGVYSYIRVLPDGFLLKSVVFNFISKEIRPAKHEYMNIHPPPPPLLSAYHVTIHSSCHVPSQGTY